MTEHFVLESITAILVVVIPSVLGAMATKFTAKSWQERKEKFQLKKDQLKFKHEIQKNCDATLAAVLTNTMFFLNAIKENYYSNFNLKSDEKVYYKITIPDGEENQPEKLLSEIIKKFRSNRLEINAEAWKFFSIINVYYNSEKIGQAYDKFFDMENNIQGLISLIANTKKAEDLEKYNELLITKNSELLNVGSELSKLIANTPLKNVPD